MSTEYGAQDRVPTEILISRLEELSRAVTEGKDAVSREFTMRIPAEMDRDADLVLHAAAARLREFMAAAEAEVQLPERPEPEDCESLSFDAYSGFQMLAYDRACAEAQRLMTPNVKAEGQP